MLIRVSFFGNLRDRMKKSRMTLEIPHGSSVRNFIFELAKDRDSNLITKLIDEKDKIRSETAVLVNGRNIKYLKGLDTELKDRDSVSILPIAGGG